MRASGRARRAGILAGLALALAGVAGCSHARAAAVAGPTLGTADLLVLAPHPDDETLMAAGVLADAVAAGERVAVVLVTNGDFTCARNGWAREAETVAALALLGVPESAVTFLGYPDGWLLELPDAPLPPIERRAADGSCARGNTTYAARGDGGVDEHTRRTGKPAQYTQAALEEDLAAVLERLAPREVYVAHGIDTHPDHAATYSFLRRALERLAARAPAFSLPTLHRAVVHAGVCWPLTGTARPCDAPQFAPGGPLPPLPPPLEGYRARERRPVPPAMRSAAAEENLKLRAIAAYPSQTGGDALHHWLASFARADEAFFPETLVREPETGTLVREPPGPAQRGAGAQTFRGLGGGGYRLELPGDGSTVTLVRAAGTPVRKWLLPADPPGAAAHAWSLRIEPRPDDGPVVEITLRRDGRFLGLAVDRSEAIP